MWYWVAVLLLGLYFFCSVWFLFGSFLQLHLLLKSRKEPLDTNKYSGELLVFPSVTIQVPVYNERHVIKRLLVALGKLDYPKHLFDIQVLDDSTDDTSEIIKHASQLLKQNGIQINILRRKDRTGYKAGALQTGLLHCNGDLIAIFDADFIPGPDFLKRMCTYFNDKTVGGVQGRWTHDNLHENSLTVIQAFLLDSHFNIEQRGRSAAGYFINFNGTAGIWRKRCIIESGGWNGDVLTEDLELSYRAQLMGWKLRYDNQIIVPAELPSEMNAFKAQQFRWAKGMAQTASKHLNTVINLQASSAKKLHAAYHLVSSISFVVIMGNILLSGPIIAGRHFVPGFANLSNIILYTGITLPVLCIYYYFGTMATLTRKTFWKYLLLFLTVYMALSVQNSIAVVQGLSGRLSPFIRTPKLSGKTVDSYIDSSTTYINWLELLTAAYMLVVIIFSIYWSDYFLIFFLLMVFSGLLILNTSTINKFIKIIVNTSSTAKHPKLSGQNSY